MQYFIKTFGCAMNVSDSERISAFLEAQNFSPAPTDQTADLVIFNTCGIRQAAENRAYSIINNLRKARGHKVKIVLTGCLAKRPDVQKRMRSRVDLFFPINNFGEFENWILENCLEIGNWKLEIPVQKNNSTIQENVAYLSINPKHTNNFQAFVPIMTGCNNFCAYCVVPHARGREVSRPTEEILSEIQALIKNGYKQITLLGQNVNSYRGAQSTKRKAPNKEIDFPQLLKMINKIPGKFWIQFVSSHPKDMSDELIEAVTKLPKVCEWIHLPVQAGNDDVLRRMNRRYTKAHYLKLVRKINQAFKQHKPQVLHSLSSDIIVGFPGETRAQFADSEQVMQKAKFDMVFFGQFSPRPGTAAWQMKDNVSQTEKARRENVLNEILKKTALAKNKKYVGTVQEILLEKTKNGEYFGKTRTQKNVKIITGKKLAIGTFVKVKITKANVWNLEAVLK